MGQERPYYSDSTASRLLSEVKYYQARLVGASGTSSESQVLFFFYLSTWVLYCMYLTYFYWTFNLGTWYSILCIMVVWLPHFQRLFQLPNFLSSYYLPSL